MTSPAKTIALFIGVASITACNAHGHQLPVLTKEVFFAAAKKCGAKDPEFTFTVNGTLPSFSYLDLGPFNTGHATPTSQCLADSLKEYRFQSMSIRTPPVPATGA